MVGISTPHLSRSCSTAICLTVCAPAPSWPCASCATLRYTVCLAPQADLLHHLGPSKFGHGLVGDLSLSSNMRDYHSLAVDCRTSSTCTGRFRAWTH
jgi:hypothetical protein